VSGDRARLDVAAGIARLRLIRPQARNAIDREMVLAIGAALEACEAQPGVRCLLITAEGPTFSVGGDLAYLAAMPEQLSEELGEMIGHYHATLHRLAALPAPVVCAVRGAVAGGALGLLWCSDIVLAADGTRFTGGFSRLGLSGDGASTFFLPQLVGLRRALELTLDARVLSAAEALDWGLISRVVAPEALDGAAEEAARRYAAGPTVAYAQQRRLLRSAWTATFAEQLEAERQAMIRCGATADAREGIEAFAARRTPRFEGR
jgi:2-(1,2-epoxy-1,2-dihydrophenyl)acetyl-CoA isomerase